MKKHIWSKLRSGVAGALCIAMAVSSAAAFDPTCDESYYVTTDAYGVPQHASVVKSYAMNGAKQVTDYGAYTAISNLTNSVKATQKDGTVVFELGEDAPDRFYFEGDTEEPLTLLPWNLTVSYQLNGAPAEADDLAGATGLIEITVDAIPNLTAPEYYRDNLMLQAATLVDQDHIVSLEAEGAQVQTIANMKAVVFLAFPGEEAHFTLKIGSNDFAFAGWTFLMIPGTLSQINEISELREVKEKTENSAEAISDSLDVILSTMGGMSSDLRRAADGLDTLNGARATISSGKGAVYSSADKALDSLTGIQNALTPFRDHLQNTASALTTVNSQMNQLDSTLGAFQPLLNDLGESMDDVQRDLEAVTEMIDDADTRELKSALKALTRDLDTLSGRTESMGKYLDQITSAADGILDAAERGDLAGLKSKLAVLKQKIQQGAQSGDAQTQAICKELLTSLAKLETIIGQMQDHMGGVETELNLIGMVVQEVENVLGALEDLGDATSGTLHSTGETVGDLAGLTESLRDAVAYFEDYQDNLSGLTGSLADSAGTLSRCAALADDLADVVHGMQATVNEYHPGLLSLIADSQTAIDRASAGIGALTDFCKSFESLAQKAGKQLDVGTNATLSGLSGTLRKTASGFDQTPVIQNAKDTVEDLVRDEWDSHTGDIDRLLLMDPDAEAVSLTSEKNPAPTSLQILVRTAEITSGDEDTGAQDVDETFHAEGNFWSRLVEIFRSIKMAILSLFGKS